MTPNETMAHLLCPTEQGGHGFDDYILFPMESQSLEAIHTRDHYEDNGGLLTHPNHAA